MKTVFSIDQENFRHDNIEEAIESLEFLKDDVVCIWKGEAVGFRASAFLPDSGSFLESMSEQAYDEVGDFADDWPNTTAEQQKELMEAIEKIVEEWADKHKLNPAFFGVKDIQELKIKFLDSSGKWEYVT